MRQPITATARANELALFNQLTHRQTQGIAVLDVELLLQLLQMPGFFGMLFYKVVDILLANVHVIRSVARSEAEIRVLYPD